jgi:hypothetical protein
VFTTDYLIIGAGAMGMIFVDQMLTETDARMIVVDRRAMPGGHWNDAYPFVRLHQPSAYYGVGSRALGANRIDQSGLNAGYYEQASRAEILEYFDALMRERFLASGRVQYFPMSDYVDGRIVSRISGAETGVAYRKLVDTTFFNTQTPATHTPAYEIEDGVTVVAPHLLAQTAARRDAYVIVGGGKTGMDVAIWLLEMGAAPKAIHWIAPRDSWLINREITQPGDDFFAASAGGLAHQLEAAANATSLTDLFARLEQTGQLLRIDPTVEPGMYRGATMSRAEVARLATLKNVVRLGHVRALRRNEIVLDQGAVAAPEGALFVDCSARALSDRPPKSVFDGDTITLQLVRAQLVSISAATIAHVEAAYETEAEKNDLCRPIPPAVTDTDWARVTLADLRTAKRWSQDKALRRWVGEHRLSGFGSRRPTDPEAEAINRRIREARPRAEDNLARLLAASR